MADALSRSSSLRIVRVRTADAETLRLLEEYYTAVDCVLRDDPAALQEILDESGSGLWLAYFQDRVAGCVMLRALNAVPDAAECKRLYVQPAVRGHGIAAALMDALELHAQIAGYKWIYLDTYDDLKPAIALYEKRAYRTCNRYNDNPQATCFFRKRIG